MARVRQFANDLGISKNQAQNLINKGRSRKDGGSQILENVMKPVKAKDGKYKKEEKKEKKEKKEIKSVYRHTGNKIELKESMISGRGGSPVSTGIDFDPKDMFKRSFGGATSLSKKAKDGKYTKSKVTKEELLMSSDMPKERPKNLKSIAKKRKIEQDLKEGKITIGDLNEGKGYRDGGFPDLTGDGNVTKADVLKGRGVPGFARGGGIAIQGLGFKGVR